MLFSRHLFAILACSLVLGCATGRAQQSPPVDPDVSSGRQIDQVLGQVQAALWKVQNEAASAALPALSSVTLELKTELGRSAKGDLNLYVVTVGGTIDHESAQRVVLTLVPPKPYTEQPIAAGEITESLSTAILAAAKGIASAQKRKPPLLLTKLEAEIRFAIKGSGSGGAKFEIVPITASLKGEIRSSAVQVATVIFQTPGK